MNLNQGAETLLGEDDEISLLDILLVIFSNLKLLILGPLLVGLIALGISFLMSPIFIAKTTFIPPGQSAAGGAAALLGQLGGLSALAGGATGVKAPADQYIAYLESNTLRDALITKFGLMQKYGAKYQQQARERLRAATKITVDTKSGLIQIEVSDQDPQFAANLANSYIKELSIMLGNLALKEAGAKHQLLEQQLASAAEKTYRSPFVREAIIQSIIREYESNLLDGKKERPFVQQIDVAQPPEFKAKPKKAFIAIIATLITALILLILIFIRNAWKNAQADPESCVKFQELRAALKSQIH